MGINHIKARKDHKCYGMGIGVMIVDDVYPGFPGDVRNASAFPYPIQYEIIEDVDLEQLQCNTDNIVEPILKTAKKLEIMGCRAITAECGYFAYFQKAVAGSVNVPVFMSSLLQVPFIQRVIGPNKDVGIVCAYKESLSERHLNNVGIETDSNYLIAGSMDEYYCSEFHNLWSWYKRPDPPEIYYDKAEAQMVKTCVEFYEKNPSIGAIMLECTGMQPFARAIQREVDLPVYSWGTLFDYIYSVVAHRDYYGHV